MLKRIIRAYKLAKADQAKKGIVYQPSELWENFMSLRQPLITALENEDEAELYKILSNMFRNGSTAYTSHLKFWNGMVEGNEAMLAQMQQFVKHEIRMWKAYSLQPYTLHDLELPSVGNPYGCLVNSARIFPSVASHHYQMQKIRALLDWKDTGVVGEIGSGYGLIPYFLTRDTNIKYIEFDLPEILVTAQFYLMSTLPKKRFLLYGEMPTQEEYDLILLPHFCIEDLEDNSVDVFFNSHSLSEMRIDTIEHYINHIARITCKYFYHENSSIGLIRPLTKEFIMNQIEVGNFKIPASKFTQIYSMPNLFGENIYREYLYKRKPE